MRLFIVIGIAGVAGALLGGAIEAGQRSEPQSKPLVDMTQCDQDSKLNEELLTLALDCRDGLYVSAKLINRLESMVHEWTCEEIETYRQTTSKPESMPEISPVKAKAAPAGGWL